MAVHNFVPTTTIIIMFQKISDELKMHDIFLFDQPEIWEDVAKVVRVWLTLQTLESQFLSLKPDSDCKIGENRFTNGQDYSWQGRTAKCVINT